MGKKAYGTYEIAEFCNVTPATVGNWIDKGLLPTFTTGGGHRRVWTEDLLRFLQKHNIPVPETLRESDTLAILVIDDEEHIRRVIRRALQKLYPRAIIREAEDGFEAGHHLLLGAPSLIILDLMLPGMDGYKVCKMIRADDRIKRAKILAITGQDVEEAGKNILAAGADAFLAKPFDVGQLKEKAAALLGPAQSKKEK